MVGNSSTNHFKDKINYGEKLVSSLSVRIDYEETEVDPNKV